ncbi:FAD binding domain-containing [Fusarium albosuccineum]|uniref:FAD binding domain-containing n=1 Tax=Fusarium albosuccineum TaxID=1237068 RepID=A0A8H4LLX7_9HYPO|nr:FAD binding domain-containing [Fusarium albosuccineum]
MTPATKSNDDRYAAVPEAMDQLPFNGISVIVVGSGIGGLSAARELWRIGCKVRVLEKRLQEITTGDRFLLGPSGVLPMRKFPRLMRENNDIGVFPELRVFKYDGTLLTKFPIRELPSESARAELPPGTAPQETSRPRIYAAMLAQLRRVDVVVEHGCEVVSYFDDKDGARAGVELRDGTRLKADLVVAADGLQSQSGKLVYGKEVPLLPVGTAAFRASYSPELAADNALIQETYPADKAPMMCIYLGRPEDMQLFVWRFEHEIGRGAQRKDEGHSTPSWDKYSSPSMMLEWLSTHSELPPAVAEVIRLTPPGEAIDYQISMREPQLTWTSPSGRVIQVGDVAHVYHPSSGAGATQAMEDAASLAECMVLSNFDVPWAARVSNLLRFERTSCIQAFGLYSEAFRGKGRDLLRYSRWIVSHDAEDYARRRFSEALAHVQNGTSFKSTNIPPGMDYRPWTIDTLLAQKEKGEPTVLDGDWS